jgi:hypothetical protein
MGAGENGGAGVTIEPVTTASKTDRGNGPKRREFAIDGSGHRRVGRRPSRIVLNVFHRDAGAIQIEPQYSLSCGLASSNVSSCIGFPSFDDTTSESPLPRWFACFDDTTSESPLPLRSRGTRFPSVTARSSGDSLASLGRLLLVARFDRYAVSSAYFGGLPGACRSAPPTSLNVAASRHAVGPFRIPTLTAPFGCFS